MNPAGLQGALCHPGFIRFDENRPAFSKAARLSGQLAGRGEDTLLWSGNSLMLFDNRATIKAARTMDRVIDDVVSFAHETLILSGGQIYGMP